MDYTLEREMEAQLRRMVERLGGKSLKWICPGWAGVPDRICLLPGGHVYFVELKRPAGGRRGPLQKKWAEWLGGMGFDYMWVLTTADVEELEAMMLHDMGADRRAQL